MPARQQQPMSPATIIPTIPARPRANPTPPASRHLKLSSSQNIPSGQEHSPLIEAKSPPNQAA